jgi:hypothetical protein
MKSAKAVTLLPGVFSTLVSDNFLTPNSLPKQPPMALIVLLGAPSSEVKPLITYATCSHPVLSSKFTANFRIKPLIADCNKQHLLNIFWMPAWFGQQRTGLRCLPTAQCEGKYATVDAREFYFYSSCEAMSSFSVFVHNYHHW